MTKVCYNLEFSYIYKHLIINKKDLWLIAEGCTSGVHIINWITITYVVLLSFGKIAESPKFSGRKTQVFWRLARLKSCRAFYLCVGFSESLRICLQPLTSCPWVSIDGCVLSLALKRLRRWCWLSKKGDEGKCCLIYTTNPRHGAEDCSYQINVNSQFWYTSDVGCRF